MTMSSEEERALNLADIFRPVQDEMALVEATLHSVCADGSPLLEMLVGHVITDSGKRVRPALTLLAGSLFHYDPELLVPAAASVELLHTATLVHDDTVDRADTRRGRPTLNRVWNGGTAVLVGDYIFANAAATVAQTNNVRVVKVFASTLTSICGGELGQVFGAYDWRLPRADYFDRIGKKTATLFASAAEAGAILGGASEAAIAALRDYGMNLGLAFQMVDDILDFAGDEETLGKPVGNDLRQGTLTLPAIMLCEACPDDNPVKRFCEDGRDDTELLAGIEAVRNSDIIARCYGVVADFCRAAIADLEGLPDRPTKESLRQLVEFVAQRSL